MTENEDTATRPTFDALPISADLRRALEAMGFTHPTPVQLCIYEPAVRGKNLVVQARTGTGKTVAFGLPLLEKLVRKSLAAVQALILTPTRELTLQITRELEQLAQFRGTKVTAIYGGAPMGRQIEALEGGAQIVVGTPGRVLDHLRRGTMRPADVRVFVLDEADEMLSMGFARELHAIVELLPKERQGLCFSATIPPDIERMAASQLKDPEFITLSSDQVGALEVGHFVYMVHGEDKRHALVRVLEVEDPESAIVFCNTRDETKLVADVLQNKGYDADWLNGDLEQSERERIMARTREGKIRFLVATDVAARGIDISHLTHVINFDLPETAEAYVHRTGRTGRAGRTGTAVSLITPKDIGNLYLLRLTYKIRPVERQLPTVGELRTRAEQDVVAMFVEAFATRPADLADLALARRLLTHADGEKIVAGLLRDHLGARATEGRDPEQEAADARRAKNPAPMASVVEPPIAPPPPSDGEKGPTRPADEAPRAREPRRDERPEYRRERSNTRERRPQRGDERASRPPRAPAQGGAPQGDYVSWEPPVDEDDDVPLLADRPRRTEEPELPGFRESDAVEAAPTAPSDDSVGNSFEAGPSGDDPAFAEIFVNIGKMHGARPNDLQRILVDSGIVDRKDVGRIRVRERMTFVTVRREVLDRAVGALAGQALCGRSISAQPARARS